MSSYFSLPSFARAKKNRDELERSNPQEPVLKEEDERFLEKQISHSDDAPQQAKDQPATEIGEDGNEKVLSPEEQKQPSAEDQVAVPEKQPEAGDGTQESRDAGAEQEDVEDPPEQAPDDSTEKVEAVAAKAKKARKSKGFDLPSQEEAEAATQNFNFDSQDKGKQPEGQQGSDKRTWSSYLPSMSYGSKKDDSSGQASEDAAGSSQGRTWGDYANAAYSSLPSMQSLQAWASKDKDGKVEPVYNEDGTINEEKTKEKQEREVSVLLDKLDMSSINNRVFSFSAETQKIYARFSDILRDTMNGGPTAYEDMEKLMREAGPTLEKQFYSMPPFVQTLVKSLPAKLGTTLGPELMAAASEKPVADMQTRMKAASQKRDEGSTDPATSVPESTGEGNTEKTKRRVPGLKRLVGEQGAVASILRNVVNFLQTRFPFLASTTNVVMSLAVFILMFVFWYCHKRGREVRLAREADVEKEGEGYEEGRSAEVSDEESDQSSSDEKTQNGKDDVLNQSDPSQVPLPDNDAGEREKEAKTGEPTGA
ncbi:hypothetical protein D0869_09373 [Hortaea werneckii]|uniref:Uncharacterized protein n=1 Tax=Hortaea werneckii TaxID=91943 RepID=A0A3M6Z6H0_HORWE|nr:hypothetical protein KC334_g8788 [Hortaea werneckii]KAI7006380.1 hypothetical protein KC355_g7776 [Hortaea werneckii]KAI7172858.1 hypothetical protein KC324_g10625 [Hortaea werneckii]KAI7576313.1 hypothetical protein KC316_g10750 [Hortaea werneckii]KAI7662077.1 hypothetical protein KC318_g9077 [Hortaea werneckii]